jgi:predicted Zn-dependent protease
MRRLSFAVFGTLLLVLFAPGCITDPVTGETVVGIPMSDEAEVSQGAQYAPSFKAQYEGAYPDRELQSYLSGIVMGIARRSHRPDLPWNFTVLNSSEVNAFALPGGTVCITRGLLHRMNSEAEFAAVMGHEVGHVAHKHSARQMGQNLLVGLVVAGLAYGASQSESEVATLGAQLGAFGGQLLMLSYSRDHEREADQRGIEYALKGGYDPREMAGVFRIFKSLKKGRETPAWLSTHPLDDERIANVEKEVRARYPTVYGPDGASLVRSTARWDALSGRLRAAQEVYDVYDEAGREYAAAVKRGDRRALGDVLRELDGCRARLPGHALFVSGMGVVLNQLGRKREAESLFRQAASMQADLFEPHAYLAQLAFERGDDRTLFRHAERARELFPHHPLPPYLQARTWDNRGNLEKAVPLYEQVLQLAPEESEEHRFAANRLAEVRKPAR